MGLSQHMNRHLGSLGSAFYSLERVLLSGSEIPNFPPPSFTCRFTPQLLRSNHSASLLSELAISRADKSPAHHLIEVLKRRGARVRAGDARHEAYRLPALTVEKDDWT
jgi:hypothetical protein